MKVRGGSPQGKKRWRKIFLSFHRLFLSFKEGHILLKKAHQTAHTAWQRLHSQTFYILQEAEINKPQWCPFCCKENNFLTLQNSSYSGIAFGSVNCWLHLITDLEKKRLLFEMWKRRQIKGAKCIQWRGDINVVFSRENGFFLLSLSKWDMPLSKRVLLTSD